MTGIPTPTPWVAADPFIMGADGRPVAFVSMRSADEQKANAKRIVLAVNAVSRFTDEALDAGVLDQALDALSELKDVIQDVSPVDVRWAALYRILVKLGVAP
jgi:hypothetical protein